jgi:hypothetical protein
MEEQLDLTKPIVIDFKKKKKRKYSRGLKDLQISERRTADVSSRMMRSLSEGFDAYRKASDKSARKKRDGALLDMNRNLAKGLKRSLRVSSRLPVDLARVVETPGSRRFARRQFRGMARLTRLLRIR